MMSETEQWEVDSYDDFEFEGSTEVDLVTNGEGDVLYVAEDGTQVNLSNPPLSTEQARELTNNIKSTAEMLYVLIARAHAGRAWEALAYSSFEAYVKEEFNMSRSRAYQLINQNSVVEAISAAAPEGAEFHITEAAARDLKNILSDVVPEVANRTAGLSPEEAGDVIEELIRAEREKKNAGDFDAEDDDLSDDREGFSNSSYGPNNGGAYDGARFGEVEEDDLDDIDLDDMDDLLTFDEDPQEVRRNYDAVYVLYTVLNMMKDLPPVDGVIAMVPVERRVQVESSLSAPVAWLNEFTEKWNAQEWRNADAKSDAASESLDNEVENSSDFVVDDEVEDIFSDFENN